MVKIDITETVVEGGGGIMALQTSPFQLGAERQNEHTWSLPSLGHITQKLPSVSLIIPTLNEAKNLPHVLPYIPDYITEVIIVDGRSTDDTVEVARELRPDVRIALEKRKGKGAALQAGFKVATGEIIVIIDADGSMDPRDSLMYVAPLLNGADLVKGSRFIQGGGASDMTLYRKLGNLGLNLVVRALFGGQFSDLCYGFIAFWRHTLDVLNCDCSGVEVETLLNVRALRAGLHISEVPSFEAVHSPCGGKPPSIRDGLHVLKTILHERLKKPNFNLRPAGDEGARIAPFPSHLGRGIPS